MTWIVGAHRLSVLRGLQRVVAVTNDIRVAHGPERVGATNEKATRRWHHHDADVVLAGLLKMLKFKRMDSKGTLEREVKRTSKRHLYSINKYFEKFNQFASY